MDINFSGCRQLQKHQMKLKHRETEYIDEHAKSIPELQDSLYGKTVF